MKDASPQAPAPQKKKKPKKARKGNYKATKAQRCVANTKSCRKCEFRYPGGSELRECPACGEERRCRNRKHKDRASCQIHGGKGGVKPGRKFTIAKTIENAYNRILASPDVIDLSQQIGISGSRISQLNELLDEYTEVANYGSIREAHREIQRCALAGDMGGINKAIVDLDAALMPIEAQGKLWLKMNDQLEVDRRLVATQQKWLKDSDQMVTMIEVVEIITHFTRMVYKYLKNPVDRKAFAEECRSLGFAPNGKGP